ncbi:PREDICTED: multiple organellar RNA editing factor [Prunus dulcis]|uniref:PREDICTED: multiple organellar RNA editing factor n=1 Tax=Prunus dulcis TaxID=3755 RepID=A0A5E4FX85_PRUDU|nr:multiple organellar RNA editing factor 1, mitochondrial isoform X1 [Prunus dulcis]VVA32064.1 PREDICTED: multiple organellar RNA editing factor [Prunus dulcis]
MALSSLRIRRTLCALSNLHRTLSATSALSFSHASSSPLLNGPTSAQSPVSHPKSWTLLLHSRTFRSSSLSSARSAPYDNNQNEKMDPNTVLFEGCDYNHWLIVMDYPQTNRPPAEEMVRAYEETCAKGLNISVEEAKQKMYACSTTTYTGFQVVMSEEESQKFEGLPGVIFVLPDSYIDPQNKEYGGDKYVNGTIYPRPPPVHHGRQQGRYHDRNRNPDPPRYNGQGPTPNQQGNPSYNLKGPMQDRGNYGPSQTYGSQRQGDNRGPLPVNTPGGRDAYQPGRDPVPSYQGNYNQAGQQNYHPQEQRNFPEGDQRNYAPPGPVGFRRDDRNYVPPQTETHGQGLGGFQGQGTAGAYGQGPSSGVYGQGPNSGVYGQGPNSGVYGQGPNSGAYGQGPNSGAYGQGPNSGAYGQEGPRSGAYGQEGQRSGAFGQGPSSGAFGQGPSSGPFGQVTEVTASGNGQCYPGYGGDQRFSQGEQRNVQGEQSNYAPTGQTGIEQVRDPLFSN